MKFEEKNSEKSTKIKRIQAYVNITGNNLEHNMLKTIENRLGSGSSAMDEKQYNLIYMAENEVERAQ